MLSKSRCPTSSTIFFALLWWIPFILLLPLFSSLFIILGIYKIIVIILARHFKHDEIVKPVSGLDISFCSDNFFSQEPHGALAFILIVDEKLSPELVRNRMHHVLLDQDNHDYEKLTSIYPGFWMGYPFWKTATKPFDVKNHIKVIHLNGGLLTSTEELNRMLCQWMREQFAPGIPLWELRIVPHITFEDQPGTKSILILKTHHILGDGKSMLELLTKIFDKDDDDDHGEEAKFECLTKSNSLLNDILWNSKLEDERIPKPKDIDTNIRDKVVCTKTTQRDSFFLSRRNLKLIMLNMCMCMKMWKCVGAFCNSMWIWRKDVAKKFVQLSNAILLLFFTPLALMVLVRDFALHRDCWFTQKKDLVGLNLASVYIPIGKLKMIRKDLQEGSARANTSPCFWAKQGCPEGPTLEHVPVPIIVIVVSALAGALGRLLQGKGSDNKVKKSLANYEDKIAHSPEALEVSVAPATANFVIALPLEKQTETKEFGNFWTHGILQVKMRESNCFRRLHSLNNFYWKMRSQKIPEVYHSLLKFHSLLPEPILRKIANYNMGASIGVTNLAGSTHPVYIGGQKVLRKFAYFGLQWRHASMTLALVSYNGEVAATLLANESVIPTEQDVEALVSRYFMNELESLTLTPESSN